MAEQFQIQIPTMRLNSGYDIPVLGYGTWVGLDDNGEFKTEDVPKLAEALSHAIDVGYRHIDTAHLYRIEGVIGDVIRDKIVERKIERVDLFITTKVWNHNHAPEDVENSLRSSLQRLRLSYVDLALVHWPMSITEDGEDAGIDYLVTWRAMEAAQAAGLARSIGVSNFNVEQLAKLLENCTVTPAMIQVELNLNLGQRELVEFCQSRGIALTAYTPFGSMLPGRGAPGSPEPKPDTPLMLQLAVKYKKTPTQIALRHLYQRGVCFIPKSLTKARIVQNAAIFDFELTPEDSARLAEYDVGYRTVRPVFWQRVADYPFDRVELQEDVAIPETLLRWEECTGTTLV